MPVFNFNQAAFPARTPQQASPLGGVLSDAIAKRLAMAKTQAEEEKAPYAGISSLADTLSKTAYAGAVTPQFQSKLLENVMTAANIPETERQRVLAQILQYGGASGGAAGTSSNPAIGRLQSLVSQKLQQATANPQTSPLGNIASSIMRLFGGNQNAPSGAQGRQPPEINQPALDLYNADRGQPTPAATPGTAPAAPQSNPAAPTQGGSWFGKVGKAKGTMAQGEKEGVARADASAQYGKDAKFVLAQQRASKQIISLLHDPDIKGMIQIPFFNKVVKSAYEQAGSKETQEKIGRLDTAINNYIAASPQRTDADKDFLISQKPNAKDPLPVKLGKLAQLEIYNEAYFEQLKLANKYVRAGDDQTTAEIKAAQDVDIDKIEKRINNEIFGNSKGNLSGTPSGNNSGVNWIRRNGKLVRAR
jgi:hypothetical protein